MVTKLIDAFLDRPYLVVMGLGALLAIGLWAMLNIPVDAFPDLTNNQVSIVAEAPGMAAVEVEDLVTFPIESALMGIPNTQEVRSLSKLGLSMITVVFDDDVPSLQARQLVSERLLDARSSLPDGVNPQMGLFATPFGEVFQYTVQNTNPGNGLSAMDLKTLHDWEIKYQLRAIPGVADVVTWGGLTKRFEVIVDPRRLRSYGLSLRDVFERLRDNNANLSAGFIEHASEQYSVRGLGRAQTPEELGAIVLTAQGGTPVRISDVAEVRVGNVPRQGAVTRDGAGETLSGMVIMLKGQNSKTIIERIKNAIADMAPSLPEGVTLAPFYDQAEVIDGTIRTVRNNLLEGGALVIVVLFFALGQLRAAAIVAAVIPLSMLGGFIGMTVAGISANLMSLGAVDFGVMIEGAIVVVENSVRRLHEAEASGEKVDRMEVVRQSVHEVAPPVLAGVSIMIIVYMPVLSLQGLEGRMFRPMAVTVCAAVLTSLMLALFFLPTASRFVLRGDDKEGALARLLMKGETVYEKILGKVLDHRYLAVAVTLLLVSSAVGSLAFIGTEFMPRLDEGSILVQTLKLPSISLSESVRVQEEIEQELSALPEVTSVVSKIGRPDFATEAMGIYEADTYINLLPHDQWKSAATKEGLIDVMAARLERIPGVVYNFTQPMAMRLDETVSGVRADVALKIFGDDASVLEDLADKILAQMSQVPGAADVQRGVFSGAAEWRVRIRRDELARFGLNVSDVQELLGAAISGREATEVIDGRRRFQTVIRLPKRYRSNIEELRNLQLQTAGGAWVRLADVADVSEESTPEVIQRENSQRRLVVQCNVRGRDVGGFVAEAQRVIRANVDLPVGYFLKWGGQFENQERAMSRLAIVTPTALLLIFLINYLTFRSIRLSLLVLMLAPFATVGGVAALWLRGMNLNVSASIGFITVFGIATIDGLVLVSAINRRLAQGMAMRPALLEAARTRVRPVVMISLVAALGLLPMATATSTGAEVQRPLATVVIGGVISAMTLTLLVVPAFYPWFSSRRRSAETAEKP